MTKPLGSGKKTKVIERSVQNNRFCFLELNKRKGQLTNPGTKLNKNNRRILNQSFFDISILVVWINLPYVKISLVFQSFQCWIRGGSGLTPTWVLTLT